MTIDLTTEELATLVNNAQFAFTRKENEILQRVHLKFKQALKHGEPEKCVHAWVLARTYEGYESICVRCQNTPKVPIKFPREDKINE